MTALSPTCIENRYQDEEILLQRRTAAFEAIATAGECWRCGVCLHLPQDFPLRICGQGFTPRLLLVQSGKKHYFLLKTSV